MSKQLPSRPSLDHLRDQAKALLSDHRKGDTIAKERFEGSLPNLKPGAVALHDAQSVIAREYGFPSWPKLVAHVERLRATEGITFEIESEYIDASLSDSPQRLRRLVELYPALPRFSPTCALVSAETDIVQGIPAIDKIGGRDMTPLEYVVYSRIHKAFPEKVPAQLECARLLLERGADPNTPHHYGEWSLPILFEASAVLGHLEMVRLLLEFGANPNDGESIYHSAEHGRIEILEELLAHGGEIGPSSEHLGFLVWYQEFDPGARDALRGARWLLERGANPNVFRGEREETPLHAACRFSTGTDLLALLVDHGADPSLKDGNGNTPYQIAYLVGNREAIRFFEARGIRDDVNADQAFLAACARNDVSRIRQALADDPRLTTRLGLQAGELMREFATKGQTDGLLGLLEAGIPVTGDQDPTPLHFACIQGRSEAVRILIAHGSPLDVPDTFHKSLPMGWACYGSIHHNHPRANHADVVRQLLAAGSPLEDARQQLTEMDLPSDVAQPLGVALEMAEELTDSQADSNAPTIMSSAMAQLYIGLSGFDYKEWQGDGLFYPATLARAKYLEYYGSRLNSLELNGTHQQVPSEASVARWNAATPDGFVFSPKMHQRVTHFTRLKPEGLDTLNLFVERLEPLEKAGKLGPILLQLPPNFKRDDDRLTSFLSAIPHRPTLFWSIEFRHDSWHAPEVEQILREHGIAWAVVETDEDPAQIRDTAPFLFARLRRLEYSDDQLKEWADFFRQKIAGGQNCFVYCRHKDTKAPWKWADRLRELIG